MIIIIIVVFEQFWSIQYNIEIYENEKTLHFLQGISSSRSLFGLFFPSILNININLIPFCLCTKIAI